MNPMPLEEKELNKRISKLFDKDMRWTRIHEMIKMRAPISVDDKDYYFERLENPFAKSLQSKLLKGGTNEK